MGANKTKINKHILQQLTTRTKRKRNKKKPYRNNYQFTFFFRLTSRNKSYVRKFYLKITIDKLNLFIFRYAIFLRHFPNGNIESPQVNY